MDTAHQAAMPRPAQVCLWLASCTGLFRVVAIMPMAVRCNRPRREAHGFNTWIEVAFAIMYELGAFLPVKRQKQNGEVVVMFLADEGAARLQHTTMVEQSETAHFLTQQVLSLIPERMMPEIPRGQVRAGYMMGHAGFRAGILLRPEFPAQTYVAKEARTIFQGEQALTAGFAKKVKQWDEDIQLCEISWPERMKRMKVQQQKVKDVRARRS